MEEVAHRWLWGRLKARRSSSPHSKCQYGHLPLREALTQFTEQNSFVLVQGAEHEILSAGVEEVGLVGVQRGKQISAKCWKLSRCTWYDC